MFKRIQHFFENRSPYSIMILLYIIGLVIISALLVNLKISSPDAFFGALAGGLIGFIGSLLLKDISLYIEERNKKQTIHKNTKFVYGMYKIELEQNIRHLRDMIEKKWIPYYRLKSTTRDSFWGQLTDYSKDLDLFMKLSAIYQEFELINNKIDIMNTLRMHIFIVGDGDAKSRLEKDRMEQLEGAIGLGNNVIRLTEECINILNTKISQV